MKYYPAYLDLRGRRCAVFGGGELAAQKVDGLRSAGAKVTVIAETFSADLERLGLAGEIDLQRRAYRPGDLSEIDLAIDASEDEMLGLAISDEARETRTWLNVVDRPSLCDFIAPAIVRRGDLTIAISTGGASPALARRIRQDLERVYGDEYGAALKVMRAIRDRLRDGATPAGYRQAVFKALAASPLCRYLRDGRLAEVDRLLAGIIGPEVSLASLELEFSTGEEE